MTDVSNGSLSVSEMRQINGNTLKLGQVLARWQRGNNQYTRWATIAHDKELEDIEQRYSDLRRQRERKNQSTSRK